jgi:hypothetical protein
MRNVVIIANSHSRSSLVASNPGAKASAFLSQYLPRYGWRPLIVRQWKGDEANQVTVALDEIPSHLSSFGETSEVVFGVHAVCSLGRQLIRASQWVHHQHFGGRLLRPIWSSLGAGLTGLARLNGDSHESGGGWAPVATEAAVRIAQATEVDAVLAMTGWDVPFAAQRCHRRTGIPWIQYFHDPWQLFVAPIGRPLIGAYLRRCILSSASAIAHCTPRWARELMQELKRPVSCLINAYDSEQMTVARMQPFDRFTVVYAGTIEVSVRDPRVFFTGLALLRAAMPELEDTMQFVYIGDQDEILRQRACECGVIDLVRCVEPLSPLEVLPFMKGAHLLLMMLDQTNPVNLGRLGGKTAEYVGSGRPILLTSQTRKSCDTDVIRLIRDTGAGWIARDDHEVAVVLRQLLEQYRAVGDTTRPGQGRYPTGDLSYQRQAQKLALLLERVARGERDPVVEDLTVEYPWSGTD